MRPIAATQSSQRFPLNRLFGAESHVRILRVLAEPGEPLSTPVIAVRAALTAPGARKALASLVQTGLIEHTGRGRRRQYALRRNEPLANEIIRLFDSELHHFGDQPTGSRSKALARLIERDPSLIKRARLHVEEVLEKDPGPATRYLLEWRDVLESYTPNRLADLLTSTGERIERLSSCNPFTAILSNNEREYLLNVGQVEF